MHKRTIRLTNSVVIFIMTGIIYVFMEVFFTSVVMDNIKDKYHFKPIPGAVYEQMSYKPFPDPTISNEIKPLSLIGASSIWMFLVGGLSGLALFLIHRYGRKRLNLFFQSILGSLAITILELLSGLLLNGWLKLYIWDYSTLFLNFLGQICLSHTVIYILVICPVAFWFFHFLEAQYKETPEESYSFFHHYRHLFIPHGVSIEKMVEKILNK